MTDEIVKLQSQLDLLNNEFRAAQGKIRKLESRNVWRQPNIGALIVLIAAAALFIGTWTTKASSDHALSIDVPNKVTAPFEVVDKEGKTIMLVKEKGAAGDDRGAYIYSPKGTSVVDMIAEQYTNGGTVAVSNGESNQKKQVYLQSDKDFSGLSIYKADGNSPAVSIGAISGKNSAYVKVAGDNGKLAAGLESQPSGGKLSIYGTGDLPVTTIQSDGAGGNVSVNDTGGNLVASMFTKSGAGGVKVSKTGDPQTYASMNAADASLGLVVRKASAKRAFLGVDNDGVGVVYVFSKTDQPVAGITTYDLGKGLVGVFGPTGKPIAFLAESDKHPGGGNVTATNPDGEGIFSAGYTGEGGDACIDRKSGLKCLGVGLPLQINE
jgi:hypothetical protein